MTWTAPRYVGVDVGGTKIRALMVEHSQRGAPPTVLDRVEVPSAGDGEAMVAAIGESIGLLIRRHATVPAAIGVGLAGFVDRHGIVRRAPNTPGLVDVDVAGRLGARFDLPTMVDNDANCAAVAAHHLVAGDAESLVAITLGTGIGGGIVLDGRLLRGAHGFAGEPGHMVIDRDGPECACGQRGCWEVFASGTGLARLARIAADAGRAPSILDAAGGSLEDIRGEHVTAQLAAGASDAGAVFREFAGYVALGIANVVVLLDPDVVVIGGGMSAHGELLERMVDDELRDRFPSASSGRDVRIEVTPGGPDAGAIGAAILGAYHHGV